MSSPANLQTRSPAAALYSADSPATLATPALTPSVKRISSAGLMDGRREVEIEHGGKIYRLRVTQLNKLILTA